MKIWKKTLAAVLAGMLCIISMPQVQPLLPAFSAAAAEETGTVGALTYTLKSDRAIITQCDKNAEKVEIPSEIAGKPVLQIAERAFLYHEKLTRVVIPDTVRTIENSAFSHCSQLQEVTLPKYLVTIGSSSFSYCAQLEELDVPKTVKNIGHSAFYGTAWLKHQQAENPLVQVNHILIDANACTDTTIVVPDGVTEIGGYAFSVLTQLREIVLPDSVTKIGRGAFWQCLKLEKIQIPDSVTTIESRAFYVCEALQELEIPAGVTQLPERVFSCCASLEKLTIRGILTEIGEAAFSDCPKLAEIYTTMSEADWNAIPVGAENEPLEQATIHYNSILEELLLADLDNSGTVDSTDVFYILLGVAQSAVGMDSGWTPAQEKAADIDGSGAVDSTDVFYVLLYIARNSAGIPTTWEMLVA